MDCLNGLRSTKTLQSGFFPTRAPSHAVAPSLTCARGSIAGAPHRQIGLALFGRLHVERNWADPSDHLRDSVRRAVRRGRSLMNGPAGSILPSLSWARRDRYTASWLSSVRCLGPVSIVSPFFTLSGGQPPALDVPPSPPHLRWPSLPRVRHVRSILNPFKLRHALVIDFASGVTQVERQSMPNATQKTAIRVTSGSAGRGRDQRQPPDLVVSENVKVQ
ncbi:DUF2285 domain-containing protein [Mesorhizobium sp. C372A]|uniref:DNA -binding domain-containing protein n=1 Tax=Mesorhizobium sp. C372A TaxID=2956829 RepID=UPI00336A756E